MVKQLFPVLTGQDKINRDAQTFLDSTDWMVLRNRDQVESGVETSLTDAEYKELLAERQKARDSIIR